MVILSYCRFGHYARRRSPPGAEGSAFTRERVCAEHFLARHGVRGETLPVILFLLAYTVQNSPAPAPPAVVLMQRAPQSSDELNESNRTDLCGNYTPISYGVPPRPPRHMATHEYDENTIGIGCTTAALVRVRRKKHVRVRRKKHVGPQANALANAVNRAVRSLALVTST